MEGIVNLRRTIDAVAVSTFALSGCSTNYAPRPSPRVAVVMQGGTPVYIREGRVHPGGGFGGDLGEAVRGNPEAESYAKSYRTNMIAGVTTTLAGVASAIGGGILYVASAAGPEDERQTTSEVIGGTLAVSGIAAFATGMVLMLNAQPHLWDAVNAYNDGVDDGGSRAYGSHVTPQRYGAYAPAAPLGTASYGAALGTASYNAPEGAPPSGLPMTLPPPERPNATGTLPPEIVPPPASGAGPNVAAPPVPDLVLDDVESE
jgi:hypothetical protein